MIALTAIIALVYTVPIDRHGSSTESSIGGTSAMSMAVYIAFSKAQMRA